MSHNRQRFFQAVTSGDLEAVKSFSDAALQTIGNTCIYQGKSALMIAAQNLDAGMFDFLCDKKIFNSNFIHSDEGLSTLHYLVIAQGCTPIIADDNFHQIFARIAREKIKFASPFTLQRIVDTAIANQNLTLYNFLINSGHTSNYQNELSTLNWEEKIHFVQHKLQQYQANSYVSTYQLKDIMNWLLTNKQISINSNTIKITNHADINNLTEQLHDQKPYVDSLQTIVTDTLRDGPLPPNAVEPVMREISKQTMHKNFLGNERAVFINNLMWFFAWASETNKYKMLTTIQFIQSLSLDDFEEVYYGTLSAMNQSENRLLELTDEQQHVKNFVGSIDYLRSIEDYNLTHRSIPKKNIAPLFIGEKVNLLAFASGIYSINQLNQFLLLLQGNADFSDLPLVYQLSNLATSMSLIFDRETDDWTAAHPKYGIVSKLSVREAVRYIFYSLLGQRSNTDNDNLVIFRTQFCYLDANNEHKINSNFSRLPFERVKSYLSHIKNTPVYLELHKLEETTFARKMENGTTLVNMAILNNELSRLAHLIELGYKFTVVDKQIAKDNPLLEFDKNSVMQEVILRKLEEFTLQPPNALINFYQNHPLKSKFLIVLLCWSAVFALTHSIVDVKQKFYKWSDAFLFMLAEVGGWVALPALIIFTLKYYIEYEAEQRKNEFISRNSHNINNDVEFELNNSLLSIVRDEENHSSVPDESIQVAELNFSTSCVNHTDCEEMLIDISALESRNERTNSAEHSAGDSIEQLIKHVDQIMKAFGGETSQAVNEQDMFTETKAANINLTLPVTKNNNYDNVHPSNMHSFYQAVNSNHKNIVINVEKLKKQLGVKDKPEAEVKTVEEKKSAALSLT